MEQLIKDYLLSNNHEKYLIEKGIRFTEFHDIKTYFKIKIGNEEAHSGIQKFQSYKTNL